MPDEKHIRIVSQPHWLYGRAYFLEERVRAFGIFGGRWAWVKIPNYIPFKTEHAAKAAAEEYAKGTWISDSAVFRGE